MQGVAGCFRVLQGVHLDFFVARVWCVRVCVCTCVCIRVYVCVHVCMYVCTEHGCCRICCGAPRLPISSLPHHISKVAHTTLQHATLQHTATHCNTLHRNTLQHTAAPRGRPYCRCYITQVRRMQHIATRCNTLHCKTLQHTALQHTATHYTTIYDNILRRPAAVHIVAVASHK